MNPQQEPRQQVSSLRPAVDIELLLLVQGVLAVGSRVGLVLSFKYYDYYYDYHLYHYWYFSYVPGPKTEQWLCGWREALGSLRSYARQQLSGLELDRLRQCTNTGKWTHYINAPSASTSWPRMVPVPLLLPLLCCGLHVKKQSRGYTSTAQQHPTDSCEISSSSFQNLAPSQQDLRIKKFWALREPLLQP